MCDCHIWTVSAHRKTAASEQRLALHFITLCREVNTGTWLVKRLITLEYALKMAWITKMVVFLSFVVSCALAGSSTAMMSAYPSMMASNVVASPSVSSVMAVMPAATPSSRMASSYAMTPWVKSATGGMDTSATNNQGNVGPSTAKVSAMMSSSVNTTTTSTTEASGGGRNFLVPSAISLIMLAISSMVFCLV